MQFLPTNQSNRRYSTRRSRRTKLNKSGPRSGMSKIMHSPFSTTQGMSTLKLVLMFSVLGAILHWFLPMILMQMIPEMMPDDAKYYGTLGAILITGFFLVISLLKGFIQRHRSSQHEKTESESSSTQLFNPKNLGQ